MIFIEASMYAAPGGALSGSLCVRALAVRINSCVCVRARECVPACVRRDEERWESRERRECRVDHESQGCRGRQEHDIPVLSKY